jgi:hypothetical protein
LKPLDLFEARAQSFLTLRADAPQRLKSGEKHTMSHAALHHRHLDTRGQISHRHGHIHIGTLRKIYGRSFATSLSPSSTLYEVLELYGAGSLTELHLKMLQQDFDDGLLERKIRKVTVRK